jgi:Transposase DDE domain group 1
MDVPQIALRKKPNEVTYVPQCTPEQLRFPPLDGLTVRADFDSGALSSDFGPLLLRGIDRQIGLTQCLAPAFDDKRHPSHTDHLLQELLRQRIFQGTRGPIQRPH